MLNYYNIFRVMQNNSEEKIIDAIYGNWYGNNVKSIIIFLIYSWLLSVFLIPINFNLFFIIYVFSVIIFAFLIGTRRCGLAITKNRVVYAKLGHVGLKVKEVYEASFENLKAVTLTKVFFNRFLKFSFIGNSGKLVIIKVKYFSYVLNIGSSEYSKSSVNITRKFEELQKILDRGDF